MAINTDRERNLKLAIHHATLLQNRKDVESTILESLEELIDYPTAANATPSHPSPSDLTAFRKHILPFQISDYDALIEERNAAGKCGYVFCPHPFKPDASRGKFRIIWGSRDHDLKVVPSAQVPRWCSIQCARRAMYIKVQLSEVPAWERAGGLGNKVDVLRDRDEDALAWKMRDLTLDSGAEEDKLKQAMEELALERGDIASQISARTAAFAGITVKENEGVGQPRPPDADAPVRGEDQGHLKIEGYVPGAKSDEFETDAAVHDHNWSLT